MKYLLSKGLIYNIDKNNMITLWKNGEFIKLNKNESIIWNFFSWTPKNADEIKNKNIHSLEFSLETLIQKGVICVSEKEEVNESIFFILARNKIKPLNISTKEKIKSGNYKQIIKDIKSLNHLTSFDKTVYNYIKDYNGEISISDIILILDNKLFKFDYFTDGYDDNYLSYAFKSNKSRDVIDSIMKLLDAKLIYIS